MVNGQNPPTQEVPAREEWLYIEDILNLVYVSDFEDTSDEEVNQEDDEFWWDEEVEWSPDSSSGIILHIRKFC